MAVQPGDEQFAFRHQQHAAEMALQRGAALRLHPAEAAALDDGGVGRLGQVGEVGVGQSLDPLDHEVAGGLHGNGGVQGSHRMKLASIASPIGPLFSTWN